LSSAASTAKSQVLATSLTATDFRSVYGDLLDLVLDADPESILPGAYAPLGLLAT
jgi:hypothetical protein